MTANAGFASVGITIDTAESTGDAFHSEWNHTIKPRESWRFIVRTVLRQRTA